MHFPSAAHSETLSSGPSPPQTGGGISHFLLLSLHVFLGRVHGDAEIVPEKNRESFPLSANGFLVLVTDASVGRILGGAHIVPEKMREFSPV